MSPPARRPALVALVFSLLLTAACGDDVGTSTPEVLAGVDAPTAAPTDDSGPEPTPGVDTPAVEPTSTPVPSWLPDGSAPAPEVLRVQVVERLGHDPAAFTQGLEFADGRLFESRGQPGESGISEIDRATGAVLRWMPLPGEANGIDTFGEGITLVGDRIIMLTWKNEVAYVFDRDTFELVSTFGYDGQGWGICYDGTVLHMSDGSDRLTRRDPATFDVIDTVDVTFDGMPLGSLNELECIGERVYANVWKQEAVVVIDPTTGSVETVIDARGLLTPAEAAAADVLNGIAYDAVTQTLLLTGKDWPAMFAVRLVE